ncbi:hypothetical protein Hypma_001681 [Hypsizygus marmoreus]|uniref:F-box domain-containing protein n=1 Tax=Hypsizygus marmoreus TaxID=39966 RepID=A0A369J7K6_HYPMA|nr:hypothetical protein Hypma_001681 [Hypsizygus marmoreus]
MDPSQTTTVFNSDRFLLLDIVPIICEQANSISGRIAVLNALARTCRLFYEPALTCLWSELSSIAPLVKCLPADAWEEVENNNMKTLQLTRPIVGSDIHRMQFHARLVKVFRFDSYTKPQVLYNTFAGLGEILMKERVLFLPNIDELSWLVLSDRDLTLLGLFLARNVRKLSILISGQSARLQAALIDALELLKYCRRIRWFEIGALPIYDLAPVQIISRTVCGLTDLHTLSLSSLSSEAFTHVASLPHLQNLTLTDVGTISQFMLPVPPTVPFSALQQAIFLKCHSADIGTALFHAVSHSPLVQLNVHIDCRPKGELEQCLLKIPYTHHAAHKSLETLHLVSTISTMGVEFPTDMFTTDADTVDADISVMDINIFTMDTLRPLFVFINLQSLALQLSTGFDVNDVEVEEIGRAWPRLVELTLWLPKSQAHDRPHVTLKGVVALSQLCPNLKYLRIAFDASPDAVSAAGSFLEQGVVNNTLFMLHNPSAWPIGDAEQISSVLNVMFPELYLVTGESEVWTEVGKKAGSMLRGMRL